QRIIERNDVEFAGFSCAHVVVQRDATPIAAAALLCATVARVVRQDVAHRARRDGEEVCTALPGLGRTLDELHERLVDDRSGLQRVCAPVSTQISAGERTQLAVDLLE